MSNCFNQQTRTLLLISLMKLWTDLYLVNSRCQSHTEIIFTVCKNAQLQGINFIIFLLRRACRERGALIAVGESLVREIARLRQDIEARSSIVSDMRGVRAETETAKALEVRNTDMTLFLQIHKVFSFGKKQKAVGKGGKQNAVQFFQQMEPQVALQQEEWWHKSSPSSITMCAKIIFP